MVRRRLDATAADLQHHLRRRRRQHLLPLQRRHCPPRSVGRLDRARRRRRSEQRVGTVSPPRGAAPGPQSAVGIRPELQLDTVHDHRRRQSLAARFPRLHGRGQARRQAPRQDGPPPAAQRPGHHLRGLPGAGLRHHPLLANDRAARLRAQARDTRTHRPGNSRPESAPTSSTCSIGTSRARSPPPRRPSRWAGTRSSTAAATRSRP